MVGELVRNPEHEPRAYAVMPFVWSIGTIIGRKREPRNIKLHVVY